ncbi:helix-turn-helix transcriptional regulator [Paenibacillus sp. FSL R5-0486]|uniref:helix-turn-helix domain-containing protein n=1 Tax=Paenibacillus sp. FSL R5-0486 TaxID=2921645 RepID=UPI0030D9EB62
MEIELVIFGEIIRNRRLELNISQESLALKADMDRSYVSEIERGHKNPSLSKILALTTALKLNPHELFYLFDESLYKKKQENNHQSM